MPESARTFEDLSVFQRARELIRAIYTLTRSSPFSDDRGLVDQIRRASVSVLSNIAEGFERGGNPELIQFLYIAKAKDPAAKSGPNCSSRPIRATSRPKRTRALLPTVAASVPC